MSRETIVMVFLGLFTTAAATGEPLYRWYDDRGQVHFSDLPPSITNGSQIERLQRPRFVPPARPPEQNPYSILRQSERLAAERQRLQEARAKQRALERENNLRERELAIREQRLAAEQQAPTDVVSRPGILLRPRRPPKQRWPVEVPQNRGLWRNEHPAYQPRQARPHRHRNDAGHQRTMPRVKSPATETE